MAIARPSEPLLLVVIPLTIAGGLWVDTAFGALGALLVSIWVWGLFGLLLLSLGAPLRRALLTCLVLATAGELVLTELWQLYHYRAGFLPAYVPPGHCLLYYMGVLLCRHLPPGQSGKSLPSWVLGFELALALSVLWRARPDPAGVLAAIAVGLMVWFGKNRSLYAVMSILALVMEIWGTELAVWTWRPTLTATSFLLANPPLGVGILYCTLDMLVLAFRRRPLASPDRAVTSASGR